MRHIHIRALRGAIVLASLAVIAVVPNLAGATPPVDTARVTVALDGHGHGHVTVLKLGTTDPPVECPTECLLTVDVGTKLSFKAQADAGSYFAGFGEPCAGTPEACDTLIAGATRLVATFQEQPTVTIGLQGVGKGSVTVRAVAADGTTTPLYSCTADCSRKLVPGTKIILVPLATSGSVFAGWNGEPCAGLPENCGVTVQRSFKVSAAFRFGAQGSTAASVGW